MSITAKLTSEHSAFNASMTTTKGIIGASLTEEHSAFNAFINTSTSIPDHLEIEGTWAGFCLCGHNVSENISGLIFKCVYRNGSYIHVTPTYAPTVWQDTEGIQTITFTYEEDGVSMSASKSADVIRQPISLTVTGSWTNEQNVGSVVDTTGLVFTVTYHDDTTKVVEPVVSPSVWQESGLQTATFTYTEHGFTVSAQKSVEVYAILVSLSVSGTWANEQSVGSAPDLTGLEFTAHFNDSSSQTILHSAIEVSPAAWASSGTQTATFSYTYRGVTKTTSKDVEVSKLPAIYQEVEYLESTGTQYIVIESTPLSVSEYSFYCKVSPTALSGVSSASYNGIMGDNGSPQMGFYTTGWTVGNAGSDKPYPPVVGQIYELEYSKNFDGKYFVDGQDTGLTRTGNMGMKLFWVESRQTNVKVKLYHAYFKIRYGFLIYDFIPCYRKSDNVAGMYDLVSEQFFTNVGTGEFIVGPNVTA